MKWFIDTEFYEWGKNGRGGIDLISIGMVNMAGVEFYAENSAFDWGQVSDDHWLHENVKPHLNGPRLHPDDIRDNILNIVGPKPEFWGWYSNYDWVVFCWLFGRMVDLPPHFPMMCRDLRQFAHDRHYDTSQLPAVEGNAHNALDDAKWNRVAYDHISGKAVAA